MKEPLVQSHLLQLRSIEPNSVPSDILKGSERVILNPPNPTGVGYEALNYRPRRLLFLLSYINYSVMRFPFSFIPIHLYARLPRRLSPALGFVFRFHDKIRKGKKGEKETKKEFSNFACTSDVFIHI